MAATAGCAWTATSSAPWLTVTSGASGNGNGTVGYSVAANTEYVGADGDDQRRRADVHGDAGGGGVQHDHLADGELADRGRRGGDGGGDGKAGSCAWTAASNAPWITITAGASGSGNGRSSYTVAANSATTAAPAR